jgi:hypothetical protein
LPHLTRRPSGRSACASMANRVLHSGQPRIIDVPSSCVSRYTPLRAARLRRVSRNFDQIGMRRKGQNYRHATRRRHSRAYHRRHRLYASLATCQLLSCGSAESA